MSIDYQGDGLPMGSEPLQVKVTGNKVYLDAEDQRQYDESRKFIDQNPTYEATLENNEKMIDWLELRNVRLTTENLQKAYNCIFKGEPEPAVMTPDILFKKVTPGSPWLKGKEGPIKFEPISNYNADEWDPIPDLDPNPDPQKMPKTVAGALKNAEPSTAPTSQLMEVLQQIMALEHLEKAKKEAAAAAAEAEKAELKKNVAPMPEAWYNDIVELNTERKIKDELD